MSVVSAATCEGKVSHESKARANSVLKGMLKRRRRKGTAFAIYRCRFCRMWHIGSDVGRGKAVPPDRRWGA